MIRVEENSLKEIDDDEMKTPSGFNKSYCTSFRGFLRLGIIVIIIHLHYANILKYLYRFY